MGDKKTLLYHATDAKNAGSIIRMQQFSVKKDIKNEELLGEGAYFYNCRQDAVEWNSRTINKKNKNLLPSYKEMLDRYTIIESEIEINDNEILNLDNRDDIIKYKIAVKTIKETLKDIDNYNDKNQLGTIINFLYRNKRINKKMVVKTIPYNLPNSYGIKICKKIYCVKDTKILLYFKLGAPINWNEYNEMKQLYS